MNYRHINLILIALLLCVNIKAQSGTTSISGTVFDQNKQAVSGAKITLSNAEKGFNRTAISNENGLFVFPSIQTGVYRLEIEANGFKKFVQTEVRAVIDTPTEISVVLEIGDINEIVIIESDTALNKKDATLGNPFNSNQLTQLPTEARETVNLLTLQPGVTRFGYVAGGRSDQANITLDGVDINDNVTGDIFTPALRLNSEAIEEFRVTTTNANASQGRSSGAQISLVTKSGTNNFRGAIFLSGRRTAWTANDFFNNRAGIERPKLDRNLFGGAIGGAIRKNRAFFFYSYEGERTRRGESVLRVVPLESLGQGIVRFRNTNGQIAALNCTQIAAVFPSTMGCNPNTLTLFASVASRYRANSFEIGDNLNTSGFRFNSDDKIRKNSHVLRLDFNVSNNQQAFFRANYINDFQTDAPQFPDTPAPAVWNHPLGFVIGHNWTISPKIFNNFRFGLTRDATTNFGDSNENAVSFVNVYAPHRSIREFSPVTTVFNFTDDLTFLRGNHTVQFGVNLRFIGNRLESFARSFDAATVNAMQFQGGATVVSNPLNAYQIAESSLRGVQDSVAALIGRFSVYNLRYSFGRDGTLQPVGEARTREFRNEEFDFYVQDVWKISTNLTATFGLRYNFSRPLRESGGYEIKPTVSLSEFFERRADGAANGTPYNEPLVFDLSGKANGKSSLYKADKNDFQPRIALAWSPNVGWFFGRNNQSVIRGGFAVTNDRLGEILAVRYEANNNIGFTQASQLRRNLTNNLGQQFTVFNPTIRNLSALPTLTIPFQPAGVNSPQIIATGFDENLSSPIHYSWNLTFERTLPKSFIVSVSYLGRKARNLLQARDAAAIADFVDPQSGTSWSAAATQLEILRGQNTPVSQVSQIPYFANLFPANLSALLGCSPNFNQTQAVYSLVSGGCGSRIDWTNVQLRLSRLSSRFPNQHIFYQPQFGSYTAWGSIGKSVYQGLTFSLRQRLGTRLTFDFNYTFSNSKDDGSSLQNASVFNESAFIINPFRQEDFYAPSDFDMRHVVNANWIFKLPFGRGETVFKNLNKFADFVIGGWQVAGIFRYNSGLPISAPKETFWTTNWSIESYATRIANVRTCPTRGGSLFGCNSLEAYRSFRNAYPGETGERNVFRLPSFWTLDLGFGKIFKMPWENQRLQFRWEIFNLTNTQKMGAVSENTIGLDPHNAAQVPTNFAAFTVIQGTPRSMQFVLRYSF